MNPIFSTRAAVWRMPRHAIIYCGLLLAFVAGRVSADIQPDPLAARAALEDVARQMVAALQDPAVRRDAAQMRRLVDRVLVPRIDFRASSNLVLGAYWKEASEAQREAFTDEFQAFLVRFYTGALTSYVNAAEVPTNVMSFREEPRSKGARQVIVRAYVVQSDGAEVPVEYRMYWRDSWKLIDVSVDGISMVQNYRRNFGSMVKHQGLDRLIAQLHDRNGSFAAN